MTFPSDISGKNSSLTSLWIFLTLALSFRNFWRSADLCRRDNDNDIGVGVVDGFGGDFRFMFGVNMFSFWLIGTSTNWSCCRGRLGKKEKKSRYPFSGFPDRTGKPDYRYRDFSINCDVIFRSRASRVSSRRCCFCFPEFRRFTSSNVLNRKSRRRRGCPSSVCFVDQCFGSSC